MNYYEHHLGDYKRDAAHLTLLQEGAYRRLLDAYYAREQPIPADPEELVYQLAGAHSTIEKKAVDFVLAQFFHADGVARVFRHKRCDKEIKRYVEAEPERERKREGDRERQQRARDRRSKLFAALREHGHVPSYDTSTGDLEAILSRVTKTNGHGMNGVTYTTVTRDNTATSPQSQSPSANPEDLPPNPLVAEGASRQRRSEHRRQTDAGREVWNQVISPDPPPRTPRIQAALDAIGGFQRVRMRTADEEPRIRREFCDAYASAEVPHGH